MYADESFTVTITAKGQPLAGASVSLDGGTAVTSGGSGTVSFKTSKGAHTITATADFGNYEEGTKNITVGEKSPGFELLTLIIAIGIAFILLRRRKK